MSQQFDQFYGTGTNEPPATWDVQRFSLVADTTLENPFGLGGQVERQIPKPFTTLLINDIERPCDIFIGAGKTYSLGRFYPGTKQLFSFVTSQDYITVTFQNDPPYTPSGIFTIDALHPIVEIWLSNRDFNWQELQDDGPPAVVYKAKNYLPLNNTDFRVIEVPNMSRPVTAFTMLGSEAVDINAHFVEWAGSNVEHMKAQHIGAVSEYTTWESGYSDAVRGSQRAYASSFAVMYTRVLGSDPYAIALTLVADTPKMFCTLWHPSSDFFNMRLRRVDFALIDTSDATDLTVWLCGITTQPTGGSSMLKSAHKITDTTDVEARSAPSGGASDSGERYGMTYYPLGITSAASAANPPNPLHWENLYDDTVIDGLQPLKVESQIAAGFGILIDSTVNTTIHALARLWFTEH